MKRSECALPLLLLVIAVTMGCSQGLSRPLPTMLPLAAIPATRQSVALPSTFTPVPKPVALPRRAGPPTPTQPVTVAAITFPTAKPTATFVPTEPRSALAGYREHPPSTVNCDGQGVVYRSSFASAVGGPWRYYSAYLPKCYGRDGRVYPVLYLFHGSIQTDSHWLELGLKQYLDAGIDQGRYPPFIVILPFSGQIGNMTSGGNQSIEAITVQTLVPYIDEAYCAWSAREGRSLGGISRGGYWALMIAFRHTAMFSSVSGHSSHLRFETDAPKYNPLATYATTDLSTMRIWLDWGEEDFLRVGQEQLHSSLASIGVLHEAHVNIGGHSDQYWSAHLQEYIDWHASAWPRDRNLYPECHNSG